MTDRVIDLGALLMGLLLGIGGGAAAYVLCVKGGLLPIGDGQLPMYGFMAVGAMAGYWVVFRRSPVHEQVGD
ncbi:MAG: hypothetical protein L6Q73_17515 [Aquabacterium sp.]|nr:hypothetical protein [Aquabacterium sp.]